MPSAETFRIDLQIGDVVEIGLPDPESQEIRWSSPQVLMNVGSNVLGASKIVELGSERLLTTISTEWGFVRPVKEEDRWTPLQAAIGMVEGVFVGVSEVKREAENYTLLRMIAKHVDKLNTTLVKRAQRGPVEYSYTPDI